jgi:hypothetical protein
MLTAARHVCSTKQTRGNKQDDSSLLRVGVRRLRLCSCLCHTPFCGQPTGNKKQMPVKRKRTGQKERAARHHEGKTSGSNKTKHPEQADRLTSSNRLLRLVVGGLQDVQGALCTPSSQRELGCSCSNAGAKDGLLVNGPAARPNISF